MLTEFEQKLLAFMSLVETSLNARTSPQLHEMGKMEGRRAYVEVGHDDAGSRFVRVWRNDGGRSVLFFVERETSNIYGAKGWKAYNPARQYGTLDTMSEWDWAGNVYGNHVGDVSRTGKSSLVPKADRR